MKCPATKQVQQKDTSDPPLFSVTYFNQHTCSTSSNPMGSTRDIAAQSSSRKAVSICFSPHTASEQPAFLTSSATPQSPNIHSFRANQQPERSPMQASFSGQPHRHLQVTVRFRWRLTVFQEQAFHPAAGVLCLGHCCRLVSPDASSTSISCDAVHGRRRLYMLGGRLVPVWSVKCWEATLLSRAWTTGTQPTDRSPYRYYSHVAYFFTFMFKPRFCAWMMWRMILEFLLFDSTWYRKGLLR